MPIKMIASAPSRVTALGQPEYVVDPADNAAAMRQLGFERILSRAAEFYDLSKNINDYFLTGVPIIWSDLPNRNGIAMSLEDLTAWNKKKGCLAYEGWKGQAVRVEHDWNGPAIGLIPDVALKQLRGFGMSHLWKVITLLAVDRTKDTERAKKIESNELNSWSMGCLVGRFSCSICGSEEKECDHLPEGVNFRDHKGKIAFRNAHEIDAEEVSSVGDPAYGVAIADKIITY